MRILALAVSIILAVACLAACGGGEEEKAAPVATVTPAAPEEGTPAATPAPAGEAAKEVKITYVEEDEPVQGKEIWLSYYNESGDTWTTESRVTDKDGLTVFPVPAGRYGESATFTYAFSQSQVDESIDKIQQGVKLGIRIPPDPSQTSLWLKIDGDIIESLEGSFQMWIPTPAPAPPPTPAPSEAGLTPGSLSNLSSYRYSVKMELKGLESLLTESMGAPPGEEPSTLAETVEMRIEGAFVAPDKAESHIQISGMEEELALTVIGNQQWMKWGDLVMGPEEFTEDISDMDVALAMWEGFSQESGGLTCASEKKETVNGIPSRYCGIDRATFEQMASLFGGTEEMGDIDELSLEMWLAEDGGWPVRLRAHVAGTDETGQEFDAKVDMDITDVNEEIDIEPPS